MGIEDTRTQAFLLLPADRPRQRWFYPDITESAQDFEALSCYIQIIAFNDYRHLRHCCERAIISGAPDMARISFFLRPP